MIEAVTDTPQGNHYLHQKPRRIIVPAIDTPAREIITYTRRLKC